MRRVVRENIKAGADIIKLFLTGTVPADSITCYPSPEEIRAGIEEAHRAGLPVTAHCIGGSSFDLCLELGIDCLEHGYFLTEKQVEQLTQSDTWLVLTPIPVPTSPRSGKARFRRLWQPVFVTGARRRNVYCREVREGIFPGDEHCYRMIDGEEKKFIELMKRR